MTVVKLFFKAGSLFKLIENTVRFSRMGKNIVLVYIIRYSRYVTWKHLLCYTICSLLCPHRNVTSLLESEANTFLWLCEGEH